MNRFRKVIRNESADDFIEELKKGGLDFSFRKGSDCTEIFIDDMHYVFVKNHNFPQRKIYLFKNVKREAQKWLKNNSVAIPNEDRSVHWNYEFDVNNKLAGTDINHAYWRIAYLKGIISEKTYIAGLDDDCKSLRLATISVLGREKIFDVYEEGKEVGQDKVQQGDDELKDMFRMIRNTCWFFMSELADNLGDDFMCWKVDCIYYKATENNIQMVQKYFDDKGLTYKQLSY